MPPCPCGTNLPESDCCGPYLDGDRPAPTALALMRSRYSAFVRGAVDYLLDTYDPATRDPREREAITRWSKESTWTGLEVLATERGGEGDADGTVEFRARYRQGGVARAHHERSRFRQLDGRWYYVDGAAPAKPRPPARPSLVPRNAPCPCGSGEKYKKCCGR